jgi:hypothetical protein
MLWYVWMKNNRRSSPNYADGMKNCRVRIWSQLILKISFLFLKIIGFLDFAHHSVF